MRKRTKIVIDEAVPKETYLRFQSFLNKKGYHNCEPLFIALEHPGMPDSHIVHHLLNHKTIFLTTDRPLHNKVILRN